ncbi:hypothetical protein HG531_009305 [Fusarium graminearum]|nr:hypothetical protein HG531_009305 [Fusarium graminearum]
MGVLTFTTVSVSSDSRLTEAEQQTGPRRDGHSARQERQRRDLRQHQWQFQILGDGRDPPAGRASELLHQKKGSVGCSPGRSRDQQRDTWCCLTTVVVVVVSVPGSSISAARASSSQSRTGLGVVVLVLVLIFGAGGLILASLSVEKSTKLAAVLLVILIRVLDRGVMLSVCVTKFVVITIPGSGVSSSSASGTKSRASLGVMFVPIMFLNTGSLILAALSAEETAELAIMVLILVLLLLDLFSVMGLLVVLAKKRECSLLVLLRLSSIGSLTQSSSLLVIIVSLVQLVRAIGSTTSDTGSSKTLFKV